MITFQIWKVIICLLLAQQIVDHDASLVGRSINRLFEISEFYKSTYETCVVVNNLLCEQQANDHFPNLDKIREGKVFVAPKGKEFSVFGLTDIFELGTSFAIRK